MVTIVATKGVKYPDKELYDFVMQELDKRGINEIEVGKVAYELQHEYYPDVTVEQFGSELKNVLKKREVLNILAIGFELDNLAAENKLTPVLHTIIANDLGMFGVDEALAFNITQLYGTISSSNFGLGDKVKLGLAKKLDTEDGKVNTFADDLFLALCSAVVARFGHGSALALQ